MDFCLECSCKLNNEGFCSNPRCQYSETDQPEDFICTDQLMRIGWGGPNNARSSSLYFFSNF